ncbi:hypothetical protein BC351_29155 [Paenibacillus ferrarius]|uniref:Uncharacterized protein n=1 Tax=Paenibacillus ferrarius TaxID=1469647 RepID=A0A1V4HHN1_9BACL|nr:hypothetical protein [Paenibacillus ferrarius]OPH56236.1 hypothetical protein BC351_29155 [Paenibacillus ferrarius]
MKIQSISYPTPLSQIVDIENDNIDIFVELQDGMTYTLVVSTPKNQLWYMDKEGLDYIPPHPPDIIVRSLTEENIWKAVESFATGNAYWLKLYYLSGSREAAFDITRLDQMIEMIKIDNED